MVKAKKKFGQNFLKDESIKNQIIQAIPKFSRIVEIGPGLGDLTQKLILLDIKLECYEIDSDLYEILLGKFDAYINTKKLKLRNIDALLAWNEISQSEYFLVANLPYYVATNIILKALEDEQCFGFVVMVQKEVAIKFCAKAGDSEFSSLAILASLYGECELLFDVGSECFEPAPKVTSSVIRLKKTKKTDLNLDKFKSFLKVAFASPRKTLLKNLSQIYNKEFLNSLFLSHNISLNIRPHELSVALYKKIFKEVENERK